FDFQSLPLEVIANHRAPDNYDVNVLVRWGDALTAKAPAFDIVTLTGEQQSEQFGFNCDFVGYFPLPKGSKSSDHGLLFVNREYATQDEMMAGDGNEHATSTERTALEQAAIGASVVEIKREGGTWRLIENSAYARRLTVRTPIAVSGPAAGAERLRTSAD